MPRRNSEETKLRLAQAFRKLMATTSIDRITVKNLVEQCGINRQTFYYHFHDIYDLLRWIYINDLQSALNECMNCKSWEDGLRTLLLRLEADSAYLNSIYATSSYYPRLRQEFLDILADRLNPVFTPMFERLDYDDEYRGFLIRLYSLVLYEYAEKRARGVSFSTLDSFVDNWLRSLNDQFRGALYS